MTQILLNDVVFLAAAACCVAFLILLVVLLERYNRLRDQMVADEAVDVPLSQSQTVPVAAVPVVPERSLQPPASTPEPANAPPAGHPGSVAAGATAATTATAAVDRNAPAGASTTAGITDEHNIRAQMHELTQLLDAMNESLHHSDAERARETEKLAAAMRTLGEALTVVSQRLQSAGATGSLQSVEQKLDRVIGLLEKGRTDGA